MCCSLIARENRQNGHMVRFYISICQVIADYQLKISNDHSTVSPFASTVSERVEVAVIKAGDDVTEAL